MSRFDLSKAQTQLLNYLLDSSPGMSLGYTLDLTGAANLTSLPRPIPPLAHPIHSACNSSSQKPGLGPRCPWPSCPTMSLNPEISNSDFSHASSLLSISTVLIRPSLFLDRFLTMSSTLALSASNFSSPFVHIWYGWTITPVVAY